MPVMTCSVRPTTCPWDVAVVDVAHAASIRRWHHAGNLSAGRGCHHQLRVVGHNHVRMDVAAPVQCNLPQVLQVAHTVHIGAEAWFAIMAALHDARWKVGEIEARPARHGGARTGMPSVSTGNRTRSVEASREAPVGKCTLPAAALH